MKNMKHLLLGSAAGLAMVAGAQAADLPVKAKPVEYVKVCSLYGAGFFYIPGTDTCIKLGGAVRLQTEYNAGSGAVPVGFGSTTEASQGLQNRVNTNDVNFRSRIYFSVDTRQQTDYGTLRSFVRMGVQETTPGDAGGGTSNGVAFWDRAFIQLAGFTVGRTVSFFDGMSPYDMNYQNQRPMGDSGAYGVTLWAYTATFKDGVTATISAEDPTPRGKFVVKQGPDFGLGVGVVTSNGLAGQSGSNNGFLYPDIIGNLRVDQTWGSAQIMAAMHDASGAYYGTDAASGHPDNAFGWAAGGAFTVNLPGIGATSHLVNQPNIDQIKFQGVYGKGAAGYVSDSVGTSTLFNGGSHVAAAWIFDGIYSPGSSVDLTSGWSAYAGYQHIWSAQWRTSLYGGYQKFSYDQAATTAMCAGGFINFVLAAGTSCAAGLFDNSIFQVGSRTQWNPVDQIDIGLDVEYSRLGTALGGATATTSIPILGAGNIVNFADEGIWSVNFRVQRNFWP